MGMIENIVIVGGGTAGWMSAVYLSIALGKGVKISLVESSKIGTIGVGEASFNTIRSFFDFLGLEENAWMPRCDASYKLAIRYEGWNSQTGHFYHPFERTGSFNGLSLSEWWLKTRREVEPHDYACFTAVSLCDSRRSPNYLDGRCFDEATEYYPYGYQFDAGLLANLLRLIAIAKGVIRIDGEVVDVVQRENGEIRSVEIAGGQSLEGDLFIDCSGFRGLLINETLGEPFISYSESLLCDRAVATTVPLSPSEDELKPYTTATTLTSGWLWEIPLYSRRGMGYVYSSQFLSEQDAEAEFLARVGNQSTEVTPRHLKMRIGRNRNSWVKNCVSIGLSSGFVEPLESTGIFTIQYAIEELVRHFPSRNFEPAVIDNYNRLVNECFDGIRDFLVLHYCLARREDTDFWNAAKEECRIPDTIREKLDLWNHRLPTERNINNSYHGFVAYSYVVMLAGLGHCPDSPLPLIEYKSSQQVDERFREVKDRAAFLTRTLPGHREYLDMLHKSQAL